MGDSAKSQLDSILKSVVSRDSTGPADTMLVNAHLSQMKMFGIRQGVEFYPMQDNFGTPVDRDWETTDLRIESS